MSNAHSSQEMTTRNVCHSIPREDYPEFLLLVLVCVDIGHGTQEEVYHVVWVLRRRLYTQYELLLIPMMLKHCEDNYI